MVVGVIESHDEAEEAGEEAGDQALVSTNQSPPPPEGAEDDGTVEDRRALTLEYRDANGDEGRVTAFRPRKRAKYSHRRIACMTWRLH